MENKELEKRYTKLIKAHHGLTTLYLSLLEDYEKLKDSKPPEFVKPPKGLPKAFVDGITKAHKAHRKIYPNPAA